MHRTPQPASSLFLQALIYFDSLYTYLYFILTLGILFIKSQALRYPQNTLAPEAIGVAFFVVLQLARLRTGSSANKRESAKATLWFLLLSLPILLFGFYYLYLQTYVYVFT